MKRNSVETTHYQTFESLKQKENESEFWGARKLSKIFQYYEYRNFLHVIEKAKEACKKSWHTIEHHFVDVNEMISIGKGGQRRVANLFRATQTEEKLRREQVKGKTKANQTHFDVNKKARQTIKELGGTMPEDLSKAEKGVNPLKKELSEKSTTKGKK